jgi:hypothetical protein
VVLTGWDDSTQTWVLRNSWGTWWGENGYMRIRYGTSRVGWDANYVVYNPHSSPPPGTATLISPNSTVTTSKPTFVWTKATNTTVYRLWVKNASGTWVRQDTYTAANICGTTNCAVATTIGLANGSYTWAVQTLSATQSGPWSAQTFAVNVPSLGATTLVYPKGTIHIAKPTFIWSKVSNSTLYRLWVKNAAGTWVAQKLILGSNICGATNCAIVSPITLSNGSYTWYVQTLTDSQNGQWSGQPIKVSVADEAPSSSGDEGGVNK